MVGLYAVLVGLPIALVMVALGVGERLPAATGPLPVDLPGGTGTTSFDLALLILQVVVIVGVARLTGAVVNRFGQPRVVGEILGGLLLGPSLLGRIAPEMSAALFPAGSLGFINALAQFGLLLFMFLVGLDLDLSHLRRRAHVAVITSHASISLPFLLGVLLSLALFTRLAPRQINATIIGIYYLAFFAANQIVGTVGGWYSTMDTVQFWLFHVATAAVGLVAFALFKVLLSKRLMGDGKPEEAALA